MGHKVGGGGGSPTHGHAREVSAVKILVFVIFNLNGSLFYTLTPSKWPPLSAEKLCLSLSHLVPEILGPKVGPIITKMYYLTDFKHFVDIFLLDFLSN